MTEKEIERWIANVYYISGFKGLRTSNQQKRFVGEFYFELINLFRNDDCASFLKLSEINNYHKIIDKCWVEYFKCNTFFINDVIDRAEKLKQKEKI